MYPLIYPSIEHQADLSINLRSKEASVCYPECILEATVD